MGATRTDIVAAVRAARNELGSRIAACAVAEVPEYRDVPYDHVVRMSQEVVVLLLDTLRDGRTLSAADRQFLRNYGQARAQQGVSLEAVYTAWRIAVRLLLDALTDAGGASADVLALVRELLGRVDEATLAYSGGHRQAELELARSDTHRRGDFIRGLLAGRLTPHETQLGADSYGLDPRRRYAAFRAGPTLQDPARRLLERQLSAPAQRLFVTTIDGDFAGFTHEAADLGHALDVGFGPPVPLDQLPRSFRLATRTVATARALQLGGMQTFDHLGLALAVLADTDIGVELARRIVEPLGGGEAADVLIDTVMTWFDLGMHVEQTAKAFVVHPNTIRYRIGRFETLTRLDLRRPHDALRAWWAIQYSRMQAAAPAGLRDQ